MSLNYKYAEERNDERTPVVKEYMAYLDSIANFEDWWGISKRLHAKDFYWIIPGDDNREADGRQLRLDFECVSSFDDYTPIDQGPASCLEVLISIAQRMETECWDPDKKYLTTSYFYHELLHNLGLDKYRDDVRCQMEEYESSDFVISRWLDRIYEEDGQGGLFPLKRPYGDLRESEIWYQMHAWLSENYKAY